MPYNIKARCVVTMKAKELKILRKLLVKANRCEDLLKGFDDDATLSFNTSDGKSKPSEGSNPAQQNNLSILFLPSNQITEKRSQECLDLFERNMGEMYRNSSWDLNMKEKSAELRDDKARYLLVLDNYEILAGFLHFRFEYDDEESPTCAVLYVYEIQIESTYRGFGVGKRLMEIAERIAREQSMTKILLTVFKKNDKAMGFYTKGLGYDVDESSPSKFGDHSVDYEILSVYLN